MYLIKWLVNVYLSSFFLFRKFWLFTQNCSTPMPAALWGKYYIYYIQILINQYLRGVILSIRIVFHHKSGSLLLIFFIYLFFIEMGAPCAFKHCSWYISPFPPWVKFACLYYWKNNIGNRVLIFIKRKSSCDQIKIHTVIILKIRCSHLISSIHWD